MARIASRYDTVMSRAMLRALGMRPIARDRRGKGRRRHGTYDGFPECFRNERHVNL